MQRQPSFKGLAQEASSTAVCLARPRMLHSRSIILLVLATAVYTWLTASRSMVVQQATVSESLVARVTVRSVSRLLLEGSQEDLSSSSKQLDPAYKFKLCRGPNATESIPYLRSVRQWHSSRARQEESVTLVTQLSLERLEMLENQCRVWPDPLAAAVYVPTVRGKVASAEDPILNGSSIEDAVARLAAFHMRMHTKGSCILDLELATEDFSEEGEAGLYPFNAARNRALMLAQTEALLLLDVDFVPSPTLVVDWRTKEGYQEMMRQLNQPQAIVLPAFETANNGTKGKRLALAAARRGKEFAVREYQRGTLTGFQLAKYKRGHYTTNYSLWASQDLPYEIIYQKGYEPYVIVARNFTPWYDERFRGYGRDKIQQLTHMAGLNMIFSVHPTAFVVHVPHPKAATFKATKDSGQWERVYQIYQEVRKQARRQHFAPVVSFPNLCLS